MAIFQTIGSTIQAKAAAQLPWLVKMGIIQSADRSMTNDSRPNNWIEYADNAAGSDTLHYLIGADTSNQSALNNPNGVWARALELRQLATPAAPTITNVGTAGSTAYSYKIVAKDGAGVTLGFTPASSAGSTSTGNATLTSAHYNVVTFAKVTGAASYDIYRTASSGTPSTTGLIGSVTATYNWAGQTQTATYTFSDTGIAADGSTAPTVNTTGVAYLPVTSGITIPQIATPPAPTVTNVGTTGATTYTYEIVARGILGTTAASSATSTTTGNASLSTTNYNAVSWNPVSKAVSYDVYRTAGGATQGKIGNVLASATLTLNDTGLAGDSATAPSTNTTGAVQVAYIYDESGQPNLQIAAASSAVNWIKSTDSATGAAPEFAAVGSDTHIGLNLTPKGTSNLALVGVGDTSTANATGTGATGTATLSAQRGVVTTGSLSTAAGGTYVLTVTNTKVVAGSVVLATCGTAGAGMPTIANVVPGSGSVVITVQNIHASDAFNAALKVAIAVMS